MDADLTAPSQGRKLASIVSIDIAGYSRLAETNEATALAAVDTVRNRINSAITSHDGRLFSSAGDGFMLEFPTATGALSAAEEIAWGEGPVVRVGVHLGEVFLTEGGDMLGHGVNIAARIQQMAAPGAVLVSADVKRSVRGDLGARLIPRGSVRLDKMEETLPVFELKAVASQSRRIRRIDWRLPTGVAIAAVFVAGLALTMNRAPEAPQARVAVLPFRTIGDDPSIHSFADGLSDRVVSALGSRRIVTVAPDDAATLRGAEANRRRADLGIDLVIDGAVQRRAGALGVDARLEDSRSGTVIWSAALQGDAADAADLEARVATRIVAEMYCGERAFRRANGLSDPAALSAYLRACDLFLVHSDDSEVTYELLASLRQVTSIAPRFSAAHSDIAKYEAYFIDQFPSDQVAAIRRDVEAEARRALELDPHNADAYVARYLLFPSGRWLEGERLLRQGLALDPDWPHANGFLGNLLTEVGRVREASLHFQRAAAANPLSGGLSWSGESAISLDNIGRADLADRAVADIVRLWSDDDLDTWRVRMTIAMTERRWDQGLSLLDDRTQIPQWFSPADLAAYRAFFLASKSRNRQALEAERRALVGLPAGGRSGFAIRALSSMGFTDDAFAVIERMSDAQLNRDSLTYYLFTPGLAPLRRDVRFMHLAARLGLIEYWRATHTQPDFCSEPGLPYDCDVAEERALPRGH